MRPIKVERHLALGRPYNPGMSRQLLDPEPYWHILGAQVRKLEALGLDTLETSKVTFDPFMALAVAAQEPSKLELATGIALAFPRSPTTVAYSAWDLQRMSQGRFVLGLGSQVKGHPEPHYQHFSPHLVQPGRSTDTPPSGLRMYSRNGQKGSSAGINRHVLGDRSVVLPKLAERPFFVP